MNVCLEIFLRSTDSFHNIQNENFIPLLTCLVVLLRKDLQRKLIRLKKTKREFRLRSNDIQLIHMCLVDGRKLVLIYWSLVCEMLEFYDIMIILVFLVLFTDVEIYLRNLQHHVTKGHYSYLSGCKNTS